MWDLCVRVFCGFRMKAEEPFSPQLGGIEPSMTQSELSMQSWRGSMSITIQPRSKQNMNPYSFLTKKNLDTVCKRTFAHTAPNVFVFAVTQ